jgi:hypothetical protein
MWVYGQNGVLGTEAERFGEDIAQAVIDAYRYARSALVSQIEIRPSQPPQKA